MSSDSDLVVATLAREVAELKRRLDAAEGGSRASQLGFSSLDINVGKGYLPIYDGKVERGRIGRMPDGTVAVVSANNNTPPPVPFPALVTPMLASANVEVTQLNTGSVPYDFGYIKVWVNGEHVGNIIRVPGSLVVGPLTAGVSHNIQLSAVNQSGTESEKSAVETVIPKSVVGDIKPQEITQTLIADNSISTPKLQANSVSTNNIQALAITALQIAAAAIQADKIAAGAITASKLEAILTVVNRMIAGNPTGARVELSSAGLEQFGPNGQLYIQLGSNPGQGKTNILTIVNPMNPNEALATLDSEGTIALSGLSVNGPINLNGVDFASVLFDLPKGLVCFGRLTADSNSASTQSRIGVFELAFDAEAGRTYRFSSSSFFIAGGSFNNPCAGSLEIRYTTNGTRPTTSSQLMGDASTQDQWADSSVGSGPVRGSLTTTVGTNGATSTDSGHWHNYGANHTHGMPGHDHLTQRFAEQIGTKVEVLKAFTSNVRVRVLFCIYSYYGNVRLDTPNGDAGIQFFVEDVGPNVTATGGSSDGSGTSSGGSGTQTRTFESVYTNSWTNDSTSNPTTNTRARQGQSPEGHSVTSIGFDHAAIRAALLGATIQKVELFLYAQTWQLDTGGTVVIGHHNDAAAQPFYTFAGRGGFTAPMTRPQGAWLNLPVIYGNGLRDNQMKGFVLDHLGQSDFQSSKYRGEFAPYSDSVRRPILRITYIK